MLFRSLVVGLLGATLYMVAMQPVERHVHVATIAVPPAMTPPRPSATVIDVSSTMGSRLLGDLVKLDEGERIASVDDRRATFEDEARDAIGAHAGRPGFIDVVVAQPLGHERRVILVVH